jgi:hypothetical protein
VQAIRADKQQQKRAKSRNGNGRGVVMEKTGAEELRLKADADADWWDFSGKLWRGFKPSPSLKNPRVIED